MPGWMPGLSYPYKVEVPVRHFQENSQASAGAGELVQTMEILQITQCK